MQRDARFATDVSHELRSPLTTMTNAAAVLSRRRKEIHGVASRAVDLLLGEIHRFQQMVVDLLEISQDDHRGPGGGSPDDDREEVVDFADLVRHVAGSRDLPVSAVEVTHPAPLVPGDRRRLDRIVANLLKNAEKHGRGAVRIAVAQRPGRVRVEVDDAGPGVPERYREEIFERFARGAAAGRRGVDGGSGLGLAPVAQHVRRHAGRVHVKDRPGGGARFVVELPEAGR